MAIQRINIVALQAMSVRVRHTQTPLTTGFFEDNLKGKFDFKQLWFDNRVFNDFA